MAEDIRLEGAKAAVNSHIDSDVDLFNEMVADYNSRCGSFRYRSGDAERARRDIEPYRIAIQAEGGSNFVRTRSTASLPAPTPSGPAPDATVLAIQRKLNELGYEAGNADGLLGKSTRSAILAFQRDSGLTPDGRATSSLLQQLRRTESLLDNHQAVGTQ